MTVTATETITIPGRFNGPQESGNGGYSCGLVAARLEGPAAVRLRRPVPLDTPLELRREDDGSLRVLHEGELVVEAVPAAAADPAVPAPVTVEEARRASRGYRAPGEGIFSRCFVCGPAREDSLEVFAGPVEGRDLVASPWTPPEWTAGAEGLARAEFAWAVLDCPTYFAAYPGEGMPLSFLAEQSVRVLAPIPVGEEHVVVAWPIETDGRKRHAGAAVLSAAGQPLAVGRALMIEPRPAEAAR